MKIKKNSIKIQKNINYMNYVKIIFFIIAVIIIIILIIASLQKDTINSLDKEYDLNKDGFIIIKNILTPDQIMEIKKKCYENDHYNVKQLLINNKSLLNLMKNKIKENGYVFQDYILIIKKSSIHTCHRDNNGDLLNKNLKYLSYTLLLYIEDTEKCLGVIPNSHKNINSYNFNLKNEVQYLPCKRGDAILFDANLIHVGALNKNDNLRIQMKISHINDLPSLSYYQNYNKILNKDNNLPYSLKNVQKNLSCMFPFVSNLTHEEIVKSSGGTDNGAEIGIFQKIFSQLFYGNSKFYDLPNAF
jgi:hypothetical protein